MRVLVVQAVLAEPPAFVEPLKEPVVRTIAIREDQTLEQLHEALRLAFGWADPHLYSFWFGGPNRDSEATERDRGVERSAAGDRAEQTVFLDEVDESLAADDDHAAPPSGLISPDPRAISLTGTI